MARLIPNFDVESIENKPEHDVAKVLVESLPDNVTVYHSYPWLESERNDRTRKETLKEGEADFVVLIPEIGFLVLEVKGGPIEFDHDNRRWYRRLPSGGQRSIKDPFEQARGNTHAIKDKILQIAFPTDTNPPCTFGYSVVFPDCDYDGSPPPGCDRATILTAKDLPFLGQRIPAILRKWCRQSTYRPMSEDHLVGVKRGLNSTFRLIPVLSRQIETDEERLVLLTEDQARLLDVLDRQDRCCIEGVAGSGKTMLAVERANRFARRGLKALFVCYNKALADWIRSTLPDDSLDNIDVYHFHGLCKDLCRLARLTFSPPKNDSDKFFRNEAPSLLLNAVEKIGPRYDAVVVDEGQDFDPEWWLPLELSCKQEDQSPFYLFYDPAQNLFVDDPGLPDLGKPYHLPTNCRNTRQIAIACSTIRNAEIRTHRLAPEGRKVCAHVCIDCEQQWRKCEQLLKELKKDRLRPDQIVIQSPFRKDSKSSSFSSYGSIGGYSIVTDIRKWRAGEGVLFSTIRSFKGLEADVVIMVDMPRYGETVIFKPNDFYVGASRAKHVLEVLACDENLVSALVGK